MYDVFFSNQAAIFTIPAILGTFFFVLRMALMFMGGHDGGDLGVDADVGQPWDAVSHLDGPVLRRGPLDALQP